MPIKISQFLSGGTMIAAVPMAQGDIVAGLRTVNGIINDYKFSFPGVGINDSNGNPLLRWNAPAGTNVNYLQFASASSGAAPSLLAIGTDPNVNFNIGAQGTGHVGFLGTGGIAIPSGTTAQQPEGYLGGLRNNIETGFVEYWDTLTSAWQDITNGSAPFDATYITQTDETADIPESIPLSGLPSGFLSSITGTGVLSNRSLTSAANTRITIVNPTGAAGNPVFDLAMTAVTPGSYVNADITVDAYGRITAANDGTAGVAPAVGIPVTQTAHGFTLGESIYYTGSAYALAQANSTITAEQIGVVQEVVDADNFVYISVGLLTGLSGLTPGVVGWLSDVTPGLVQNAIPTTPTNITKPVWIAISSTEAMVYQERGKIIPNPSFTSFGFVTATTSLTVTSATGYITDGTGTITYTLPSAAAQEDYYIISGGMNTTGWIVQLPAGATLTAGNQTTSSGGTLSSTLPTDSVNIVCVGSGIFTCYGGIIGNPVTA